MGSGALEWLACLKPISFLGDGSINLIMYIYIYIYIYMCVCVCVCMYVGIYVYLSIYIFFNHLYETTIQ